MVLITAIGRAGPVWRHAFVRFTENRVIRTFFLSGVRLEHERGGDMVADFQCSVLSETAGTGRRFNPIGLHRRVKTDFSGPLGRCDRFEPYAPGVRAFGLAKSLSVRRTGFVGVLPGAAIGPKGWLPRS